MRKKYVNLMWEANVLLAYLLIKSEMHYMYFVYSNTAEKNSISWSQACTLYTSIST